MADWGRGVVQGFIIACLQYSPRGPVALAALPEDLVQFPATTYKHPYIDMHASKTSMHIKLKVNHKKEILKTNNF